MLFHFWYWARFRCKLVLLAVCLPRVRKSYYTVSLHSISRFPENHLNSKSTLFIEERIRWMQSVSALRCLLPHFPCSHPVQPSSPHFGSVTLCRSSSFPEGLWRSCPGVCWGIWILNRVCLLDHVKDNHRLIRIWLKN